MVPFDTALLDGWEACPLPSLAPPAPRTAARPCTRAWLREPEARALVLLLRENLPSPSLQRARANLSRQLRQFLAQPPQGRLRRRAHLARLLRSAGGELALTTVLVMALTRRS